MNFQVENENEFSVTPSVGHHPERRMTMICLQTVDGQKIEIPFLDTIIAEFPKGVTILSGRVFDLY